MRYCCDLDTLLNTDRELLKGPEGLLKLSRSSLFTTESYFEIIFFFQSLDVFGEKR